MEAATNITPTEKPLMMLNTSGKKDYVNRNLLHEIKYNKPFIDFINETVERNKRRNKPTYERVYRTLVFHLNEFCKVHNAILYTNSIGEVFLDDFILYLEGRNCKANYINHILSLIKAMLVKAAKYNYAVDPSYDDVTIDYTDTYAVYLSMNQITRIYYYPNLTKKQERIRDLFILGCLTALRYSDYSTLDSINFRNGFIYKIQKKTGKEVIIPMHDYVKDIIKKYGGDIPNGFTNQYFNRSIKEICKKVGIDDKIVIRYTRGGRLIEDVKEKWQIIGTHTARRSAATNMYLTGRMKTFEIMSITGHTTEESFFRYIKVTREDISKQISSDIYFRK